MRSMPGWAAMILATFLASGCTTLNSAEQTTPPAPKQASNVQVAPKPPPPVSEPGPSPSDRLALAVTLLEKGDGELAKAELKKLLAESPDNKKAAFLMRQIDTPLTKLYPKKSFTVTLVPNGSLSELAGAYLGNPLAFYGLARFNAIRVPANVKAGRVIHIPSTKSALAAHARLLRRAQNPAPKGAVRAPESRPGKSGPKAAKRLADRYYKDGLIAFQHQDLDGAIAAWNKVLAIDPAYKDAALNRAEALRLKANLKKLGG